MNSSPPPSLDHSLAHGIAWTALLKWLAQLLSWVATLYAARLLQPADYGLVAMGTIVVGLARMVEDLGLDAILVQDRTISDESRARLAGVLLVLGLSLYTLFALLAVPVAVFFKEPKVSTIVLVLSLVFIFDALQVVPRAQLQRELRFVRLALVAFLQVVVTSLVLVSTAHAGLGYWSLVVNTLAGAAAATVLLVAWSPYRLAWPRQIGRLTRPLLQGWRVLASRAAWYGYSNADQTLIGRLLGKDALGIYSFALTFSSLAQQEIGAVITRVVPGIFSEVQERRDELRRYFLLLTGFLTVITFPISIGAAVTADLLIPLILGPQWDAVIRPLQILCLYSAFLSSQLLLSHVLMWTGQFRVVMWCSILAGVGMPAVLFGAVQLGLTAVAWAWVAFLPIFTIPSFVYAFRTIDISAAQWLDSLKPGAVGCAVMAAAVLCLRAALHNIASSWLLAGASVALGALVYILVVWFGFNGRVRVLVDTARLIRGRPPAAQPE